MHETPSGNEEVLARLRDLRNNLTESDPGSYNRIISRARDLREAYPDYKDYEFYYILDDDIPDTVFSHTDFPGTHSVSWYLENLTAEAQSRSLLSRAFEKDRDGTELRIVNKIKDLRKKYGESLKTYWMYHTVSFSTPDLRVDKFDLEGEDSIVEFIKTL